MIALASDAFSCCTVAGGRHRVAEQASEHVA